MTVQLLNINKVAFIYVKDTIFHKENIA